MAEKLIRCTCGTVFDVMKAGACPDCGEQAEPAAPVTAQEETGVPIVNSSLKWKAVLLAVIVLFGVFVIKSVFFKAGEQTKTAQIQPPPESPVQSPEKNAQPKDTTLTPQQNSSSNPPKSSEGNYWGDKKYSYKSRNPFQRDNGILPPQNSHPTVYVDPKFVGAWERKADSVTYVLNVAANGNYTLAVIGGDSNLAHGGTFQAAGGRWSVSARNKDWIDGGRYTILGDNLDITDKNGDKATFKKTEGQVSVRH